jgi:putative glutamine amidotransferase
MTVRYLNIVEFMDKRPRIGITMRLDIEHRRFYLGRDYSEALVHFGATPTHIGLIPKREYIAEALRHVNGILLPGSDTDVDPFYFGEEPHPKLKKIVSEKDETEMIVLEEAEKMNLPVFAICYGMQALNVSRGGTLFQDIEAQVPDCIKHEQGVPLDRNSHQIKIAEEDSLIRKITEKCGNKTFKVNSHHHQAVKQIGENLVATSYAADGLVESIEDPRPDRFVVGVQWHPELSYKFDDLSKEIFSSFINYCANGRS